MCAVAREMPYAVILVDERRGERVVLWHRDPTLTLKPGEIDAVSCGPVKADPRGRR